jgi:DNA-binding XRE family transcriptional regulator
MSELRKYHAEQMRDPAYAAAYHLFELADAVRLLREQAGLTRGQLAKRLGVKAHNIFQVEEETPNAAEALRTVRQLRPALLPA